MFKCPFVSAAEPPSAGDSEPKPIPIASLDRKTPVDFEGEILPVLRRNCLACHNKTTTKAGLILETPQDILKGGDSGKAVAPNHSGGSLLLKLASHQDKPTMPPRNNKVEASDLTPAELGLIKLWIDQGAKGEVRGGGAIAWLPLPEGLNPIYAAALTADGQFAACGRANQIFVYHVPSGQFVTRLTDPQLLKAGIYGKPGVAHRDLVQSLAFSPDGSALASGGYREVKLWRHSSNVRRFQLSAVAPHAVTALAASPNGQWLATGGDDGSIRLWNAATAKPVRRLPGHKGAVNSLQFSPDNTRLVSGSADMTIRVWDVAKGRLLFRVQTAAEVNAVAWIFGGTQIASGGGDHLVRIWYVDNARHELGALRDLKGHEGPVTSLVSVPPEATQIISGSGDGTIRLWDVTEGQVVRRMKHGGPVSAVAVRNDGKRFASAGLNGIAKLWDAKDGREIAEMNGDAHLAWAVADRERALSFADGEVAYCKTAFQTATNEHNAQLERVKKADQALAAAGKLFGEKQTNVVKAAAAKAAAEKALTELAGIGDKLKPAEEKSKAAGKELTDAEAEARKAGFAKASAETEASLAAKGAEKTAETMTAAGAAIETAEKVEEQARAKLRAAKRRFAESQESIRSLAFSPDNLTLATAGDDQMVHTWSAENGAGFETFQGHKGAVASLAFAGAGEVVSGGFDRNAVAWDLNGAWTLERTIGSGDAGSPISDRVNALQFSPDGRFLATGGGEPTRGGEIKIWRMPDGKLMQSFTNIHSDVVFGLDFSADGKYLASGAADKFVKVLDLAAGKVTRTFEGHTHHVLGVSWKRDGRTLVSAGADDVIKVWDAATGQRRKTIEGFGKEVTSISFIGITDQILASSGDTQVCRLNLNGEKLVSFKGGTDFMDAAASTPDGKIVIGAGQDSVLRVWNGTTGEALAVFAPP